MRRAKTTLEIDNAAMRARQYQQEVYYFETVDAVMTIGPRGLRILIGEAHYMTIAQWKEYYPRNRYCIDAGQNWWVENLQEKIDLVLKEMGVES